MTGRPEQHEPEIDYPCTWAYRIIGTSETALRDAIAVIVGAREHSVGPGNRSRTGAYCSINVELVVETHDERVEIGQALSDHDAVKFLL